MAKIVPIHSHLTEEEEAALLEKAKAKGINSKKDAVIVSDISFYTRDCWKTSLFSGFPFNYLNSILLSTAILHIVFLSVLFLLHFRLSLV